MMQGIALTLDSSLGVWEFSEPTIRQVTWRLALPRRDWGQVLHRQGREWSDLIAGLPRTGNRLLEKVERVEPLQCGLKDTNLILNQLDRMVTRLALTF